MKQIFHDIFSDYELIDSGNQVLIRPEMSAIHSPALSNQEWHNIADWEFVQVSHNAGKWKSISTNAQTKWNIQLPNDIRFQLKITGFKHIGIFPEQVLNWKRIMELFQSGEKQMLNLFGYTGIASIYAAKAGYSVCHVDALKQLVDWGKQMMHQNGLDNIRWICDDAPKFVEKEIRRNHKYDLICLDPPSFGYGKGSRIWKIQDDLLPLLIQCKQILTPKANIILSLYSDTVQINELIDSLKFQGIKLKEKLEIIGTNPTGESIHHGHFLYFQT
jgi:23S rRNA (cytosine1962-C5)-methyltransferase